MLKVLHPGFLSSVQDLGRFGVAHYGVPTSGAMDVFSHQLANVILNNNPNASTIEITFGGAKFQFLIDTNICISGGNFTPKINTEEVTLNKRIQIKKGDILSFGKRKFGLRIYVAISGGFLSELKLQSRSFYKGITKQQTLQKGDNIQYKEDSSLHHNNFVKVNSNKDHFTSSFIDCYEGPEFNLLSKDQQEKLRNLLFTIGLNTSRMGYFLEETIENNFLSMLSSGVLPGTVQLTPSGKLIILMRDCQVTGGYPRVLQLTEESINRLAQKTTRDTICFKIKTLH